MKSVFSPLGPGFVFNRIIKSSAKGLLVEIFAPLSNKMKQTKETQQSDTLKEFAEKFPFGIKQPCEAISIAATLDHETTNQASRCQDPDNLSLW